MKTLKSYIPEIYLFVAIIYYWSLTALVINWFAIALLVILGTLIITKNRVLGIVIGVLLILINLYMFLALASELSEFETFNIEAKKLLGFGVAFLGMNLLFSVLMLNKYAKSPTSKVINLSNN